MVLFCKSEILLPQLGLRGGARDAEDLVRIVGLERAAQPADAETADAADANRRAAIAGIFVRHAMRRTEIGELDWEQRHARQLYIIAHHAAYRSAKACLKSELVSRRR